MSGESPSGTNMGLVKGMLPAKPSIRQSCSTRGGSAPGASSVRPNMDLARGSASEAAMLWAENISTVMLLLNLERMLLRKYISRQ